MTTRPFFGAGRVACGCEFFHRRSRWREAWDLKSTSKEESPKAVHPRSPGFQTRSRGIGTKNALDPAVCEAREREFEIRPLISRGKRPPRLPTGVIWVSNVDCSA